MVRLASSGGGSHWVESNWFPNIVEESNMRELSESELSSLASFICSQLGVTTTPID